MTQVIEVAGLRKSFGGAAALNGLDLSVAAGEVHGFLGPNGAGKTTTIRILLGMLRASGGTVRLLGGDPWREAVALHRRLAYVPGDVTLWPGLSGGEIIDLLGRLRGGLDAGRQAALIERFALDPSKKARTYSTGSRQKVALIAALATDAELLILDEPTAGLDPLMEAVFRDCVRGERQRGRTVLLSSHILSEVEALCDRVTIIRAGATVESGTLAELRHLTRTSVTAELSARPDLDNLPGLHALTIRPSADAGGPVLVHGEVDAAGLDGLLARLVAAGVRSLVSRPPTLEELFLRHYAGTPAGAAPAPEAPPAPSAGSSAGTAP
jgi:ABC-2 type transport system ATP-binding protein